MPAMWDDHQEDGPDREVDVLLSEMSKELTGDFGLFAHFELLTDFGLGH